MHQREPLENINLVCGEHAPHVQTRYRTLPAACFVGCWVKRSFPIQASAGLEHMWVWIERVLPDGDLQGRLENDPAFDVGYACGDFVLVTLAQIEDVWEP